MLKIYLAVNAVLYFALALWCTVSPAKTAVAQGFVQMTASGRAEYLTVYGGLQVGLGLFFALCAYTQRWQDVGLVFALCVYVPLVLWRVAGLLQHWPVGTTTLAVAGLEAFMLVWAGWLWFTQRGA
jgi:hypothetical protein